MSKRATALIRRMMMRDIYMLHDTKVVRASKKKTSKLLIFFTCVFLLLIGREPAGAASYTFTTLDFPEAYSTYATGINDNGEVVGYYFDSIGDGNHGFIYKGGIYTTLDDPNAFDMYGTTTGLTSAYGINNDGDIVGAYSYGSDGCYGFLYKGGVYITLDNPNATNTTYY